MDYKMESGPIKKGPWLDAFSKLTKAASTSTSNESWSNFESTEIFDGFKNGNTTAEVPNSEKIYESTIVRESKNAPIQQQKVIEKQDIVPVSLSKSSSRDTKLDYSDTDNEQNNILSHPRKRKIIDNQQPFSDDSRNHYSMHDRFLSVPYIISGYVQSICSLVAVFLILYILILFAFTIRSDLQNKADEYSKGFKNN